MEIIYCCIWSRTQRTNRLLGVHSCALRYYCHTKVRDTVGSNSPPQTSFSEMCACVCVGGGGGGEGGEGEEKEGWVHKLSVGCMSQLIRDHRKHFLLCQKSSRHK